jgi:hypothetical protein
MFYRNSILASVIYDNDFYIYHGTDLPLIENFKDQNRYLWQVIDADSKRILSAQDIIKLGSVVYLVRD